MLKYFNVVHLVIRSILRHTRVHLNTFNVFLHQTFLIRFKKLDRMRSKLIGLRDDKQNENLYPRNDR